MLKVALKTGKHLNRPPRFSAFSISQLRLRLRLRLQAPTLVPDSKLFGLTFFRANPLRTRRLPFGLPLKPLSPASELKMLTGSKISPQGVDTHAPVNTALRPKLGVFPQKQSAHSGSPCSAQQRLSPVDPFTWFCS